MYSLWPTGSVAELGSSISQSGSSSQGVMQMAVARRLLW
jgi:hypothetical protein